MNQNFVKFVKKFSNNKIAVAVSGGVDSVCLLHWLAEMNMDIVALHVNHKLRPVADTEAAYVKQLCQSMNVPCHVFEWNENKPATGIEAAARDARYAFMTNFCKENNISTLMVAHQADDQIETFLMNLARGSGIIGLAAMRETSFRDSVQIVRPLLGVFRSELIEYCNTHNIQYFSDEMNFDDKYTRVKIRQNRHLMADKLGISDSRILLAIENLGKARDAMEADVSVRVKNVIFDGYALFSESFLFDVPGTIGLKCLGTLIQIIGGNNYQPRLNSLEFALNKLQNECQFTLGHCTIRRFKNQILIVPEGAKTSIRKKNEKIKRLYHKQNKQQ